MIEQLLAEGKLQKGEADALHAKATYRYRGFVVVQWWVGLHCIRPCESGRIPTEMLGLFGFHGFNESSHPLADWTKTGCLCAGGSLEEILAHIDSWWASMRGTNIGGER